MPSAWMLLPSLLSSTFLTGVSFSLSLSLSTGITEAWYEEAVRMAEEVDCADFGLPSEFFSEDFFLENKCSGCGGEPSFPSEFPYEWAWGSATGTDAGEGDYLAGLTRQMAHFFLLDAETEKPVPIKVSPAKAVHHHLLGGEEDNREGLCMPAAQIVGSPQSILCAAGTWNYDLVEPLRGSRGTLSPLPRQPFPLLTAILAESSGDGICPGTPIRGQKQEYLARTTSAGRVGGADYLSWFTEQPKRGQLAAARRRVKGIDHCGERTAPPLASSTPAWASGSLHHQPEPPGGRCVYLGTAAKRGSGTGVFLPRQSVRPSEPRRKTGGAATVLVPAREVQALSVDVKVPLVDPDIPLSRSSAVPLQEGRAGLSSPAKTGPERFLPADWTY